MVDTTAAIVAGYGHGTRTAQAFHSAGHPRPIIEHFCGMYVVPAGVTTIQLSMQGAALANASASESDAAVASQALNALTSVTIVPASYVGAISPTTQAFHRADPEIVDLKKLSIDEIVYPHRRTVAYDASIGVVTLRFVNLANRVGTAAATLTPSVLIDGYEALCENMGAHLDAVVFLNTKQWADLTRYGLTTASSVFSAPPSQSPLFMDLLTTNGAPLGGYITSWGPIHIFIDPDPNAFGQVAGDDIGAIFVPALAGLNGWPLANQVAGRFRDIQRELPGGLPLAPAFAIGYREDPAQAPLELAIPSGMAMREFTPGGIPIDVLPRMYAGQNLGFVDAWSDVTTIEQQDLAGLGIRSAA